MTPASSGRAPRGSLRESAHRRLHARAGQPADGKPERSKYLRAHVRRPRLERFPRYDAELDDHGYVVATLPATVEREVPTIVLLAHVDMGVAAATIVHLAQI